MRLLTIETGKSEQSTSSQTLNNRAEVRKDLAQLGLSGKVINSHTLLELLVQVVFAVGEDVGAPRLGSPWLAGGGGRVEIGESAAVLVEHETLQVAVVRVGAQLGAQQLPAVPLRSLCCRRRVGGAAEVATEAEEGEGDGGGQKEGEECSSLAESVPVGAELNPLTKDAAGRDGKGEGGGVESVARGSE